MDIARSKIINAPNVTKTYNFSDFDMIEYENRILVEIKNLEAKDPKDHFIIASYDRYSLPDDMRFVYTTPDKKNLIIFNFNPTSHSRILKRYFKYIFRDAFKLLIKIFINILKKTVINKQLGFNQKFLNEEINIKPEIREKIKTYLERYVREEAEFKKRKMEFEKRKREFQERKKSSFYTSSEKSSSGYYSVNYFHK